jgi:ATP-binding cassette subfamily B protein
MENNDLINLLREMWRQIDLRRRKQLMVLMFIMIVCSLAEIMSIGAVIPFLGAITSPEKVLNYTSFSAIRNQLNINSPEQILFPVTVLFLIATFFSGFMRVVLVWYQTRLGHAIGSDFSVKVFRNTLYQPYSVHVSRNSSEIIAGIYGKVNSVVYSVLVPLLVIQSALLLLICIIFAIVMVEPVVAFSVCLSAGSVYLLIGIFSKRVLQINSAIHSRELANVMKLLQEGLGGIREILLDGTQETYCHIYKKSDEELRNAQANLTVLGAYPRLFIETLSMVAISLAAYFLVTRGHGADVIATLAIFVLAAQRLLPVMQQVYSSWLNIKSSVPILTDVVRLLKQPLPQFLPLESGHSEVLYFQEKIEIRNLDFRHASDLPWLFQNLNLIIPKGSRIGIIGSTGSGKSTLLDILMGLISPVNGKLLVDNREIIEDNCRAWQKNIGHVPQSIFLADATIKENIAFGLPSHQINLERVKSSAIKAQIASTIEGWDLGYDTIVGERGVRLSGGQRQRIGIARALYRSATIIILDEATSALDSETENSVINSIETLGEDITILMVSHRVSTFKKFEKIYSLNSGVLQIVEFDKS